jgi:hypothetical protein
MVKDIEFNLDEFDSIKIYFMDTTGPLWEGLGPANYHTSACFEIIPLSWVDGMEGLKKIMELYQPIYLKNKILVKPFKIEFLKTVKADKE